MVLGRSFVFAVGIVILKIAFRRWDLPIAESNVGMPTSEEEAR